MRGDQERKISGCNTRNLSLDFFAYGSFHGPLQTTSIPCHTGNHLH